MSFQVIARKFFIGLDSGKPLRELKRNDIYFAIDTLKWYIWGDSKGYLEWKEVHYSEANHGHSRGNISGFFGIPFWGLIPDKPSIFPPESHSHSKGDISDLWNSPFWANIPDKPSTFPPNPHEHSQSDVTDLIDDLISKAEVSHEHVEADITDLVHDAQKIKGKEVDDSAIGNNKVLKYDEASGKIVYGTGGTGGMEIHGNEYHEPDFSQVGHGHSESEVTNLVSDLASKETPSGAQAKVDEHKDLNTGVHGVGSGTISKVADIAVDSNLSVNAQDTITKKHTHSNQTLLDSYMQTEVNLADAVSKKHSHSNQTLLDSYTQTEVNLADAVSKKHSNTLDHSHSNKTLLDSYTQTEVNLADAVTKKHSHSNQTLLDSYTQTEVNLADAVNKKHSHANQTLLDSYTQTETNLADAVSKKHTQVHGSGDHSGTIGTPTQVGLANVTNDAQLKRADGDLNSFTQKATPVSADILLIEDSAVSFTKKKITVGSLPTGGGGGVDENFRKKGTTQYESWYSPICTVTALTTGALTANRLYAFPFVVPTTITLDRIAINVTTAGTGNARLGIYTNSSSLALYPDQKVLDAGEISIASTGVKSITISQQLTAGLYWLVLVSNGAPTVRSHAILGILPYLGYTSSLGAEVAAVGLYVSFTYAALPTTFPTTTTTKITAIPIPAIFVRLSA